MSAHNVELIVSVRVEGAGGLAEAMETAQVAVGKLYDADRRVSARSAFAYDAETAGTDVDSVRPE